MHLPKAASNSVRGTIASETMQFNTPNRMLRSRHLVETVISNSSSSSNYKTKVDRVVLLKHLPVLSFPHLKLYHNLLPQCQTK